MHPAHRLRIRLNVAHSRHQTFSPQFTRTGMGQAGNPPNSDDAAIGGFITCQSCQLNQLSERCEEPLGWGTEGACNAEIAQQFYVSTQTVKTHLSRSLGKLRTRDRPQAIVQSQRN